MKSKESSAGVRLVEVAFMLLPTIVPPVMSPTEANAPAGSVTVGVTPASKSKEIKYGIDAEKLEAVAASSAAVLRSRLNVFILFKML